jgi:hypothetical protein
MILDGWAVKIPTLVRNRPRTTSVNCFNDFRLPASILAHLLENVLAQVLSRLKRAKDELAMTRLVRLQQSDLFAGNMLLAGGVVKGRRYYTGLKH